MEYSDTNYDKEKYRQMILDAAETVLGYFQPSCIKSLVTCMHCIVKLTANISRMIKEYNHSSIK
jgi:hypothetical protein